MKPLKSYDSVKAEATQARVERHAKQKARGVKKVNAKRKGHRFPDGVCEDLREWCRESRCVLDGVAPNIGCLYYDGRSDPAHVIPVSRGSGDFDNLISLCRLHHMEQEGRTKAFEAKFGVNLKAIARQTTARFLKEHRP